MIEDTVKKIEDAIRKIGAGSSRDKAELLTLLAALKSEVARLAKTHEEQALSIASLADMAAHEATRQAKSPDMLKHSLDGLALSVQGFESSHPQMVKTINELCTMLANMGI